MSTFVSDDVPSHQPAIADLRKEERRWFSWLSILHERGSKPDSPNAAVVLDIAKKRWLRAREELRQQSDAEQGADD